jgi:hypothetical protein
VNQHLKNPRLQYSLKQWGSEEDSVELTGRVIIYSEFNQTSGADNRALCKASMTKDKMSISRLQTTWKLQRKKKLTDVIRPESSIAQCIKAVHVINIHACRHDLHCFSRILN